MRLRAEEKQELKRRELAYRGSYSEPEVRGKTVILIDDGIATGSTVRAAVCVLNAQHPAVHRRRADRAWGENCRFATSSSCSTRLSAAFPCDVGTLPALSGSLLC